MAMFQRILVPIDFGAATDAAITIALSLASASDAQIILVHAFDVAPFASASPFAPALDAEPIRAAMERELKALREKTAARWAKVTSVLEVGNVYDVILDVAKAHLCDLIVLGTHGRRGLSHALLGSVAEKVVRLSPIPVLTVRPGASPAASATAAREEAPQTKDRAS